MKAYHENRELGWEIRSTVRKLGGHGAIDIVFHDDCATVKVAGEYFGIYDFNRHTFVD